MIRVILHKGIKAYYHGKAAIPTRLRDVEGELRRWLSILAASNSARDLRWAGSSLTRRAGGYALAVDGLGQFMFRLTKRDLSRLYDVDQLDFQPL